MRYERKYKVDDLSLAMVHQMIKSHPASFRKIYPDRQVNNIYLDTPNYTTYAENVMGIAQRKKFRIRWYGAKENTEEKNTLEVKIKDNALGAKESYPFPTFTWKELRILGKEVSRLLPGGMALTEVLMNAYHRSYFGTSDGRFRITIDHQLRYLPLVNAGRRPDYLWEDPAIVVELKYEEDLETAAQRIMQYLPFRQTKSSKYVTGLTMLIQ